jgi:Tfp pilus assembly protein FimV
MNKLHADRSTCLSLRYGFFLVLAGLWGVACLAATPSDTAVNPPSYKPKSGESLDHVIAQTMADSPLKIELLRQAFIDLNPHAFVPAKVKAPNLQLRKGVSLTVPDSQQLLQALVPPKAELASANQNGDTSLDAAIERKSWIHFP